MAKSIIVHGRSDWGMAKYAERMRKHFGLKHVVVDFDGNVHKDNGHLYIAYCYLPGSTPSTMRVMSFEEVAKQINDSIPLTDWQSGAPPMAGEWETSETDGNFHRWWDTKVWSYAWLNQSTQEGINHMANIKHKVTFMPSWRGLSEEPILVTP